MLRGFRAGASRQPAEPLIEEAGATDLIKASRPAMGSFFEIRLPAKLPGAIELANRALDVVDALETQLTIYRDDSEVSRLNATAHVAPVRVEAGLFQLLEQAVKLGQATQGAYDVTAGALSAAWGFVRGPKRVPDPETLADARERTGFGHLHLNADERSVTFDRPGIMLNLGSIGKGYAIDRAVDYIRAQAWLPTALVHGGQSSLYACGSPPGEFGGRWQVALRNPFDPTRPLGTIRLRNRALGTSGASFQKFESGGRSYGHIIDPRTGEPPESGPASLTVLAPTAAEADALSTAFYLLGNDGAAAYVREHPDVGCIIVGDSVTEGVPRIHLFGVDEDEFEVNLACARVAQS
jgi:thiamine biosynthesis lipoprotein